MDSKVGIACIVCPLTYCRQIIRQNVDSKEAIEVLAREGLCWNKDVGRLS
jgi:hypothetical protein